MHKFKKGIYMKNTKEKILETTLELFAAKGYEAVSVSDIAGKLGMTKGALYKHYTNKQDIWTALSCGWKRWTMSGQRHFTCRRIW